MATKSPDGHIYRRISTAILNDEWFRNLPNESRYLFLMLILSPQTTLLGVNLNPQLLFYESNLSRKRAKMALRKLYPKVIYFEKLNLIWIKNFPFWQCSNPNQWKSAFKTIERLPLELQRETLTYILQKKPNLSPLVQETLRETLSETLWQTLQETIPGIIYNTDKTDRTDRTDRQIKQRVKKNYVRKSSGNKRNPSGNSFNITFNETTKRLEGITPEDIQHWQETFPNVNIKAEIKKAEAWLDANPQKRKKNYKRFLVNWFSKAQKPSAPSNNNLELEASKLWAQILKGSYPPEAKEILQQMGGARVIKNAPSDKIPILRSQFVKIYKTLKGP